VQRVILRHCILPQSPFTGRTLIHFRGLKITQPTPPSILEDVDVHLDVHVRILVDWDLAAEFDGAILLLRQHDDEARATATELKPVRHRIDLGLADVDLRLPLFKEPLADGGLMMSQRDPIIERLRGQRAEIGLENLANDGLPVNGALGLTLAGVVGARVRAIDHHLTLTLRHACRLVRHTLLAVFRCHLRATSLLAALHFLPQSYFAGRKPIHFHENGTVHSPRNENGSVVKKMKPISIRSSASACSVMNALTFKKVNDTMSLKSIVRITMSQSTCIRLGNELPNVIHGYFKDHGCTDLRTKNTKGVKEKDLYMKTPDDRTVYSEFKSNIELDTEKLPATIAKVAQINEDSRPDA
jgi:hypothetical protein